MSNSAILWLQDPQRSTPADNMAAWQFDFHLVPASAIDSRFRAVPLMISQDDYDDVFWWDDFDVIEDFQSDLTALLPPGRSWHPAMKVWGDEDGDRFDLTHKGSKIDEVFGRLDLRRLSLPFLSRFLEMARRHDLMIITEDHRLIRPSMKELLGAIHNSRGFRFVTDPEGFLRGLGNPD